MAPVFLPPAALPPSAHIAATAATAAAHARSDAPHGWTTYTVRSGDTVQAIAQRYVTTVRVIATRNRLPYGGGLIKAGQRLTVPRHHSVRAVTTTPTRTARPATTGYRVRPGDTLSDIALRRGTTVSRLLKANGLTDARAIRAGQLIRIPGSGAAPAKARAHTSAERARRAAAKHPVTTSGYRVRPGDTLTAVAARHRTTVSRLMKLNSLSTTRIVAGEALRVPAKQKASRPSSRANAARTSTPPRVASAIRTNRDVLARHSSPSRTKIKAMVATTARRHGVDPRLALAISYQESGWDQRQVSHTNAIGAMQVMPRTGDWAGEMVGRDLNLMVAQDNVTAGVVVLRWLQREATSLDMAIAGYYQGLPSVQQRGMYDDTRAYVRNVKALYGRM